MTILCSLLRKHSAIALSTLLVIASLSSACGDGDTPTPATDASTGSDLGPSDGGGSDTDAAVEIDGGGSDVDGGGSDVDGGGTDVDGGGAVIDGGATAADAGSIGIDAGPAPMCAMRSRASCCFDDGDCGGRAVRCIGAVCSAAGEGVCKGAVEPGGCWSDADCGAGRCVEPNICPCGARCLVPDSPGTCATRS